MTLTLDGAKAEDVFAGPLVTQFRLCLEPGEREEILGPVFYKEKSLTQDLTAMPPLWSCDKSREVDATEWDVLYPVLTYNRSGREYRLQLCQMLSFSGGLASQTETNVSRFTIFPIYFQQRSEVPDLNYTALLPFYGRLKNRLFRDETEFVLWPLYAKTVRRFKAEGEAEPEEFLKLPYRYLRSRRGEVTTYNYLVPIFHVRTGPGLTGWQAWPLVGAERKHSFSFTNRWDDIEVEPGHAKFFALWPIIMGQRNGVGTTNEEAFTAVLPLFSSLRSPLRDSTTIPWPVGVTYTVDRARKYREWGAPWPVVVFARGEGKTTARIWPLFSHSSNGVLTSDLILWPIYKYNRVEAPPLDRQRTRLGLFVYSDQLERNTETGKARRRVDAWPLFTFKRDFDGNESWQTFSLLEPYLPASKSVERNYSPLWAVVRAERNAATGAQSESLFWNLYRRQETPTNQHGSLLFGLVQWDAGTQGRSSRWFYLPGRVRY